MKSVGTPDDPNLGAVQAAFEALGDLGQRMVLVGGSASGLLVTATRSQMIRPTRDVDLVVEAVTSSDYRRVERALRERGFVNDQSDDAPICRWRNDEVIVDLMPMTAEVLGFGNPWYPHAVETAETVRLPDGQAVRLVAAPVFLLTKYEAFRSRGIDDLMLSHDLEDIIAVLDGRPELEDEVAAAPDEVQRAIATMCAALLSDDRLAEAMAGFLPGDAASQARSPGVFARMRRLAAD